ncbi:hypothetical protein PAAG_06027 [Paracoccidioides lutzii Pb01]|uniref:RRM domain-containing protein n=1 Tax=Paracoccidioides lutzii (strain ATCC MYA-826 / Pb01) TaxID=502779 RepID=C1H5I6_PARBA|nr:hypothetical protein PAAG_06027 [Paracoccidioides lutzii Pb01]EEH34980.1 hypothetical protein PAAG_06027 [Paracoccidioides lutzii Pb01]
MPGLKEPSHSQSPTATRKRKLDDGPALEIDLSAPEPPSKKALRKAKKKSAALQTVEPSLPISTEPVTDSNPTATLAPKSQPTENTEKPSKRSDYGVWVGNLPFTAKKSDIRKFLTGSGTLSNEDITRIHLPDGAKQNGKAQNKGFAYVDFSTSKAMETAIAMSEQLINGRRALIKNAKSYAGRPERTKGGESAAGGREVNNSSMAAAGKELSQRIFVGNLGFDVTKEILEDHFKPCGSIESVHVATFEDSGKCKGYAWVEFESIDGAEAAVRGFVKVPEEVDEDEDEDEDEELEEEGDSDAAREEERGANNKNDNEKTKNNHAKTKSKKPRMKKVWVNRILGRLLRMEFAEDKATRYRKRYGKEGTAKDKFAGGSGGSWGQGGDSEVPAIEEVSERKTKAFPPRAGKSQGSYGKGAASSGCRYTQDVVQRLSGAIVESHGKKITFD